MSRPQKQLPKVIGCSLCPELAIPYQPGEGTLLRLWSEHRAERHPEPEMVVTDV